MSAKYTKIIVEGVVQGVGFRPFVYHLAHKMGLKGWVKNVGGKVEILLNTDDCDSFISYLKLQAPIHSEIHKISIKKTISKKLYESFEILESKIETIGLESAIPRDIAICQECLDEIKNPKDRHYYYAFTTCTNCGPRYSIINSLPYDRDNTSMKPFQMCAKCQKEYDDPSNRRFHAQPNSCPECGIVLEFHMSSRRSFDNQALKDTIKAIKSGKIIAIKGIGGFALVCDGRNDKTILKLREKKDRPTKPFALMVKDIDMALKVAKLNPSEINTLNSNVAPIILGAKKSNQLHSKLIAPNLSTIGILLPYSGIHHLLLEKLDFPIVFTSANLSGEPIISSIAELKEKMSNIIDGVLDYNREIIHPIDDSVMQFVAGEIRIIRLGRGLAPLNVEFEEKLAPKTIIGMGAQQKITLTYSVGNKYMVFPYIGDLDNLGTIDRYEQMLDFFNKTYLKYPDVLISDLHKNYQSSIISAKKSIQYPCRNEKIQHHHAHFCAIFAESIKQDNTITAQTKALGIIWDGTGLGEDGKIWGGEFFVGNMQNISRVGHFKEFCLLGGENAIKNIYKIGYALALECGAKEFTKRYEIEFGSEAKILHQMFEKKINTFQTTSVGRLFDAVASLCGLLSKNSFEGEAGMLLESVFKNYSKKESYDFIITDGVIDFCPMILQIQEDVFNGERIKVARNFIYTLANIAFAFAKKYPELPVMFSGGVFQNKILCDDIRELFDLHKKKFYMHKLLPPNDMCISFGQAVYSQYNH
ncbi:carbamoyltransferase HypF [Helicobacter cappadocius]|uniref:Carbamoyltransferase n=1 Tax=Helicobacter cappadocius TaxID=3063998 RepID=A0AA90PLN4_9HELI|nr:MULTISPECIES: carbamoyltransferase HypF [unclassified Helicobacter]MDO7253811.1 carbamoyltransferase HypF [Helicobacter sp. faydin-H75]MDP2539700.1 carbamoyltransferase HypF [Helicobacter sp. faydin-H76]